MFIDQLPSTGWVTLTLPPGGNERPVELERVRAVLYRKLAMVRNPRLWSHVPERLRTFAASQTDAALSGLCALLDDRPWINHYARVAEASKIRQLAVARDLGLSIPATVVTDSAEDLRAFYEAQAGHVVVKSLSTPVVEESDEGRAFLFTSELRPDHLARAEQLLTVPVLAQARIQRGRELRVTLIDDEAFVAEAVMPADAPPDWRRGSGDYTSFRAAQLDERTLRSLRALMVELGLRYGAADLIETPDGDVAFLEVNPTGAWLWLEDELGLPIAKALAVRLSDESYATSRSSKLTPSQRTPATDS